VGIATTVPYSEVVQGGSADEGASLPPPLRLDPVGAASAAARRYVADALRALGREDLIESGRVGVSELVTNACLHAATPFVVRVLRTGSGVRIEIMDESPLIPVQNRGRPTATTGRGLFLVEAAGRWGVDDRTDGAPGKVVWFEPHPELRDVEPAADEVVD
jgi:hypothetical protein